MRARIGRPLRDLTGQVFGRLVALRPEGRTRGRAARWWCRCSCGELHRCNGNDLTSGRTRSCGCLRSELSRERVKVATAARRKAS